MEQAKLRREARIRKILENSEKRLQKITSVENKSTKTVIEDVPNFQPDKEELNSPLPDPFSENDGLQLNSSLLGLNSGKELHCKSDSSESSSSHLSASASNVKLKLENKLNVSLQKNLNRNVGIVVLPFIWSCLITVCHILHIKLNKLHINNIFLPLAAFEIQDYYFSSKNLDQPSTFLSVITVLTGKFNLKKEKFILVYLVKVFQDIMVYFFIFATSQLLFKIIFKF